MAGGMLRAPAEAPHVGAGAEMLAVRAVPPNVDGVAGMVAPGGAPNLNHAIGMLAPGGAPNAAGGARMLAPGGAPNPGGGAGMPPAPALGPAQRFNIEEALAGPPLRKSEVGSFFFF